jgi:hypothetical protein
LTEEPGFRKVKVHGKAPNARTAIPAAGLAGISCRRDAAWLGEGPTKHLPVGYFHIVVTIPAAIVDIAYQNKAMITDMLFQGLGARIGITSVLYIPGVRP